MATIDINTSQKITITYDLGTVAERFLALLIDVLILGAYAFAGLMIVMIFFLSHIDYLAFLIIVPVVTFYSLAFEMFNNGQTVGKLAVGLRVVKVDGTRPAPNDLLIRWAFRIVDIWFSAGIVAFILTTSSDKNQRLGDLLANTAVIKTRSRFGYSLAGLLQLQRREQYTPVFRNASQMAEQEMLQVKALLDRLAKYPNEGHNRALDIASENIAKKLNIPLEPYHPYFETNPFIREQERAKRAEFLRNLLKDYIILTR